MSKDLVARLRAADGMRSFPVYDEDGNYDGCGFTLLDNVELCNEAADEIERLRDEIDCLITAFDDEAYEEDFGYDDSAYDPGEDPF